MTAAYTLAPNPRYMIRDLCGNPAAYATLLTLNAETGEPMTTWLVPGVTENSPLMIAGADGQIDHDIYWKVGDDIPLYTIVARDGSGELLYEVTPYPILSGSGGGDITITTNTVNYGRNEQFIFWNDKLVYEDEDLPIGTTQIADTWFFTRTNDDAVIRIEKVVNSAGGSNAPFSPPAGLRITVSEAGGDAAGYVHQRYQSVQMLEGLQATFSIYAHTLVAASEAPLELIIAQVFGAGGSTTVVTNLAATTVTDDTTQFLTTGTIPSIVGKTIGTGGDDYLEVRWRVDTSVEQDMLLEDYSFQNGQGSGINYPYLSVDEQYVKILAFELANYHSNQGTDIIAPTGKTQYENLTEYLANIRQQNILIGWDFRTNPNQFGRVIDSTSNPTNGNGFYIADGTILISDGNNVVKKDSYIGDALRLIVVAEDKKFGIFQIIEQKNAANIASEYVSLLGLMACSEDTTVSLKMAVVGWTGTPNLPPRACVTVWGAAGVNPTLAAGYNYESVTDAFTVDDASLVVPQILENILLSSKVNYGVMVWTDDATLLEDEELIFERISLVKGRTAYDTGLEVYEASKEKCQRYVFKTYSEDYETFEGEITTNEDAMIVNFNHAFAPIYEIATDVLDPVVIGYPSVPGVLMSGFTIYLATPAFTYGQSEQHSTTYFADFSAQSAGMRLPVEMVFPPIVSLFNPETGDPDEFRWEVDYSHTGQATINFHRVVSASTPGAGSFVNTFDANTNASVISSNTQEIIIATPDRIQFGAGRNDSNPATGSFSITSLPRAYVHVVALALLGV
jgi:hypothetical protein